jgi:hypothetical protein
MPGRSGAEGEEKGALLIYWGKRGMKIRGRKNIAFKGQFWGYLGYSVYIIRQCPSIIHSFQTFPLFLKRPWIAMQR